MPNGDNFFGVEPVAPLANVGQGEGEYQENHENYEGAPEGQVDDQTQGQAPNQEGQTPSWQQEFQSPEDMYNQYKNIKKSYDHLRPKFTKTTQELSNLRKQATQPVYQQEQPVYPRQEQVPINQYQYQEQPQYVDPNAQALYGTVAQMQEQMAEIRMQNKVANMAISKQDFNEIAPDMYEVLQRMPHLWNLGEDAALDTAYAVAKVGKIESQVVSAVNNARQDAYRDKEIKVLNGTNPQRPQNFQQKSEAELIKEAILSQTNNNSYF